MAAEQEPHKALNSREDFLAAIESKDKPFVLIYAYVGAPSEQAVEYVIQKFSCSQATPN
jgi:hypothetical protein